MSDLPADFCEGLEAGDHPHPTDPTKFVVCSDGKAHVRSCPEGMQFNPALNRCDLPENIR
ncbi:chitin binding peritrophin-A domain-containing protein [Nocardia sp. NPDC023852]|uniref:chitin binding peritrophin-A domain-containing protein n=1 Tax=Nocardia sp. NPDC023852 TaxID=3154697 RepID=UPI0033C123C2